VKRRTLIAVAAGAAVVVALVALGATLARTTEPPRGRAAAGAPLWGIAGPYGSTSLARLHRQGVRVTLLELDWSRAEPREGVFDQAYLAQIRAQLATQRANGMQVVLNYGLHDPPAWLLRKPNALFVDQDGTPYTQQPLANLVFATELRPYAERYTAEVFRVLGQDFLAVRVGGGLRGELSYPSVQEAATGRIRNSYYAFDGAARRTNPVPGWKPCSPSPNNEARRFLSWYLNALTDFQNWQIATVRRHYRGYIAVLYPSWGMRSGDFEKAIATDLCGVSSAELNGEVQRGFDHARHIAGIRDPKAAVWGTWADRAPTIDWLSSLAARHDPPLATFAENSGHDGVAGMRTAVDAARRDRLKAFMWIRLTQAACGCRGYATIDDYARLISR
jgi:hypothetical protein